MKNTVLFLLVFCYGYLYSQYPNNVRVLTVEPNKPFETKGNLSNGQKIDDLSWASKSNVACFPGTQNTKFRGNHVLYAIQMPIYAELKITVIPDDKNANFSIYAYQVGTTNYSVPPNLTSCIACEAEHKWDYQKVGKTQDHTRTVELSSLYDPYNVVVGVVGADGLTSGSYTLKIELNAQNTTTETQKPLKMYSAKSEKGKVMTYIGDLKEGVPIIDLSWASKSSMACFPGTQNSKFRGNHIIFVTEQPTYTEMEITVIPDDPSQNLSLWAYQVAPNNNSYPPDISSCVECEADFKWDYAKVGKTQDHTRKVVLTSLYNPYKVVIGVAGADDSNNGKFKIKISLKENK